MAEVSPEQQPQVESPDVILRRVAGEVAKFNQGGLSPEQNQQAANTILGGVLELHRQGVIDQEDIRIRNYLQKKVFTDDPKGRELAAGLVGNIETEAARNNPQVAQLIELTSILGINDRNKYPDLAGRIDGISVKPNQQEQSSMGQERVLRRKKVVKGPSSDDFIPLAEEVEPEEPDVTQAALLVAFGDIIGYLPDTTENREMLGQASEDDPQALLKLARLGASRGYLDRTVQKLTLLTSQAPERADEIIPILKALSSCDSNNAGVYQLLGDSYLQLGKPTEAIAAYREVLRIPPKE